MRPALNWFGRWLKRVFALGRAAVQSTEELDDANRRLRVLEAQARAHQRRHR